MLSPKYDLFKPTRLALSKRLARITENVKKVFGYHMIMQFQSHLQTGETLTVLTDDLEKRRNIKLKTIKLNTILQCSVMRKYRQLLILVLYSRSHFT